MTLVLANHLKRVLRNAFKVSGYDVVRRKPADLDPRCEGFDAYAAAAKQAGMDVNDWIEGVFGWAPALPVLLDLVYPYLTSGQCVCEIGPGTGRHARHILPKIAGGSLHLYDHSRWVQGFLRHYFAAEGNVVVHDYNGGDWDLPDGAIDLAFSNGTFIELNLGAIVWHARQFARTVKVGGVVVFDYIDASTAGAAGRTWIRNP